MKIALATDYADIVGGVESYLRSVIIELVKCKIQVFLITNYKGKKKNIISGLPVNLISLEEANLEKVLDEVANFKPDYLIDNGISHSDFISRIVDKYSLVLFSHDYKFSCLSGLKRTRFPLTDCNRTLGVGCLFRYLPQACGGKNPLTMFASYRNAKKFEALYKKYKKIFVLSDRMADEHARQGINRQKIIRVPIFPTTFKPLANRPEARKQGYRAIFVGRLVEAKGWRDAIIATRYASEKIGKSVQLTIIGDGPDEIDAHKFTSLDMNVRLIGNQNSEKISYELAKHDVLIVPSRWPEPFGLVGLESMTQGVPVIGYKIGGIPEWLKDGFNGFLVEDKFNPLSLGNRLAEMLINEDLWNKLRQNSWEYSRKYTVENHLFHVLKNLGNA